MRLTLSQRAIRSDKQDRVVWRSVFRCSGTCSRIPSPCPEENEELTNEQEINQFAAEARKKRQASRPSDVDDSDYQRSESSEPAEPTIERSKWVRCLFKLIVSHSFYGTYSSPYDS